MAKSFAPSRERNPPEIFRRSFVMRPWRAASLFVKGAAGSRGKRSASSLRDENRSGGFCPARRGVCRRPSPRAAAASRGAPAPRRRSHRDAKARPGRPIGRQARSWARTIMSQAVPYPRIADRTITSRRHRRTPPRLFVLHTESGGCDFVNTLLARGLREYSTSRRGISATGSTWSTRFVAIA